MYTISIKDAHYHEFVFHNFENILKTMYIPMSISRTLFLMKSVDKIKKKLICTLRQTNAHNHEFMHNNLKTLKETFLMAYFQI